MIFRKEQNADRQQVKELWHTCFEDTNKFTDWFFDERWKSEYGVVAQDGEKIVAAMQGWPYTINIRGVKIPAVMLAGVSTHPDYRGQGIMPKCLSLFMKNSMDRGEDVVFHTPANHPTFFKSLHYSSSLTAFVSYNYNITKSYSSKARVEKITDRFAPRLIDAYNTNLSFFSGAVNRDLNDMALKLRDYAASDADLVYIEKDGKITSYAVCMGDEENVVAEEFSVFDNAQRDELLYAVSSIGKERKSKIKLPPAYSNDLPVGFTSEIKPSGVMGAANIQSILKRIANFNDISVCVTDHMQPLNQGYFTFDGTRIKKECDIEVDSGRLLQYLVGFSSIKELYEQGFCKVNNILAIDVLDRRLPKAECYVVEEY